jgi:hypothetical protein
MTVKADVTSTLNGQSADLILIEDSTYDSQKHETKALSGGTETLIFTSLDGGLDKEYTAKIVPSTTDVTQTSEVSFGAEVDIDPIPHRQADASNRIRETAEFNNGVGARELQLGDHALIGGLLTTALNDGEVLADDGFVYSTIQAAQDAASSFIFIGPGTFNESVTISTVGLTLEGSGYDTLIDGGTTADAFLINSSNVTIRNLSVQTTQGGGNNFEGVRGGAGGDSITVDGVTVRASDNFGIRFSSGSNHIVTECTVKNFDDRGIVIDAGDSIVKGCVVDGSNSTASADGIAITFDNFIIANNIVRNAPDFGIVPQAGADDGVVIGNRVISSGTDGIENRGTDNIIANNRVSDSGTNDIEDNGAGTVLDGNLTGASN